MCFLNRFLFPLCFSFSPFFSLGDEKPYKVFEEFLPIEDIGFLKKDTPYYKSPVFKNMDLIYSEKFMDIAPILSDYVEQAGFHLSKNFPVSPYIQKNFIIFLSPRRQASNALAVIYPFPSMVIYPSESRKFMDRWSMFYWPQHTITHEMAHIYQYSQNSFLDRFLRKFLGIFSYRNFMLPVFIKEGHAVFNESLYGFGGRLFSGWARAFVFSQLQTGISLKRLLKTYDDAFSDLEKYLHGAYFFAYLHSQYGLKEINRFFLESGRFLPLDFYGLNSALKRAFGEDFETLFKGYQNHYIHLALKQKVLPEKALFSSQTDLPMNGNSKQIYFLVSNMKSPPKLVVVDKETEKINMRQTVLPLGKVFYKNKQYLSAGRGRTSAASIEFSLFKKGFKPLKKYNSQYVMDVYNNKVVSLNTKQSHTQNAILLNRSFYDNTHSSAIMDHKGQVYYFKQNQRIRTLYRDKTALVSFESYSAYPVEADEEGLYFIASVPYGSSLFVYKEGEGVFRLSRGDRITYARKMKKNTFLVSEIHPSEYQYKIIKTEETPELPCLYTYSFEEKDIFNKEKEDEVNNEATNIPMEFHYLRHSRESGNLPKAALTPCGNIYELFNNNSFLDTEKQTLERTKASLDNQLDQVKPFVKDSVNGEKNFLDFQKIKAEQSNDQIISFKEEYTNIDPPQESEIQPSNEEEYMNIDSTQESEVQSSNEEEQILEQDKKPARDNRFYHSAGLTKKPLFDVQPYNPVTLMRLYQIFLIPYPKLRFLYNFQFPESFQPHKLASNFYILSLFQFSDPMNFNTLDLQGFLGSRQKFFKLYYSYNKYRPSISFSFSYEESLIKKQYFNKFRSLGFLEKQDIYSDRQTQSTLKSFVPHRDRTIDFSVKYPFMLKHYSKLSFSSQLQLGQKQFNNLAKKYNEFLFYYPPAPWKNYIRQEGKISYKYKRKYPYAYLPYFQTGITTAYDMLYVIGAEENKNRLFIDGYIQAYFTRELSKELFLSWNAIVKRELFNQIHSKTFLKSTEETIISYNSFYQRYQSLNKMDFQFLKVLNHSYYPLKIPFSIRRWAPLTGLSLLSVKPENKKEDVFLLIPFLGLEIEFHFLFERALFKAGFSGETILDIVPFSVHSPLQWSFWLKGVF